MVSPLGLDDFDGELGAVRLGEVGLVLESCRHRAVPLLARVAVFVELEQLRRQRLAAVVTLALVAIDAHFESAGIGHAGILLVVLCLGPFLGPYVNVSLAEGWPASKTGSGAAEKPADYNTVAGNRGRIEGARLGARLTCSPLQLEQGLPLGDQALLRHQPLCHSASLLGAHRY